MQDVRYGMQDARCQIQDARCRIKLPDQVARRYMHPVSGIRHLVKILKTGDSPKGKMVAASGIRHLASVSSNQIPYLQQNTQHETPIYLFFDGHGGIWVMWS